MNRAAVAVGARAVQEQMGFDGAGVGVAISIRLYPRGTTT